MALIVKETGGNFEQVKAGIYKFVCSGVWDIGIQVSEYMGETKRRHQVVLRFELDAKIQSGEFAGKRYTMNKFYTLSLNEKSTLRKDLESWRGRAFTAEELKGFDLEKIIGVCGLINVVINEKGKSVIAAIMGLQHGDNKILPELSSQETPQWIQELRAKAEIDENGISEIEEIEAHRLEIF
jgi:hypothetical protein